MYEIVVMEERKKPGLGKWKYLFIVDGLVVFMIIALLFYLKALYI